MKLKIFDDYLWLVFVSHFFLVLQLVYECSFQHYVKLGGNSYSSY